MADYRSILDRAINGLQSNTEDARRTIYEKARSALMRQLSSLQPALSPAEISKQRLQLEEAIRETENTFSGVGVFEDAVADALSDITVEQPIVEATPIAAPANEPTPVPAVVEAAPEVSIAAEPVIVQQAPAPKTPDPETPPLGDGAPEIPDFEAATAAVDALSDETLEPAEKAIIPMMDDPAPQMPKVDDPVFTPSLDTPAMEPAPSGFVNPPSPPSPIDELRETMASDGFPVQDHPGVDPAAVEPQTHANQYPTFEEPEGGGFYAGPAIAEIKERKSGGRGVVWILVLLILVGAGAFGWAQRDVVGPVISPMLETAKTHISNLFASSDEADSSDDDSPLAEVLKRASERVNKADDRILPTPAKGETSRIKIGERIKLPSSTQTTPTTVIAQVPKKTKPAQLSKLAVAPAKLDTKQEESLFTPPGADETPTAQTRSSVSTPATTTTTPASNLFTASAILYEERKGSSQADISTGNIVWELVEQGSEAFGASGLPSVRGNTRIQSRDINVRVEIMRNLDSSLPASHVIELEFKPGVLATADEVNNIAGIVTKANEQENGKLLSGAVVKVSDTLFWVAMSAQAADLASNTVALQKQSWFDIPIVFKSGKRAILTLEKGTAGTKAIDQAFVAWN